VASRDDMWAITIVALIIVVMIGGALLMSPNWKERPWTLVTRGVVEFGVGGDGRFSQRYGWFAHGYFATLDDCSLAGQAFTVGKPGPEENRWECRLQGSVQ